MGRKETCRCSDWCGMSGGGAGSQSIDQRGADEGRGFRGANNLFSAFTAMIGACYLVIVTTDQMCQLLDWMLTGWLRISLLIPLRLEGRCLGLRHFRSPVSSDASLGHLCRHYGFNQAHMDVGSSVTQFIPNSLHRKGTQGWPIDGADFYFFAGGASLVLPLCAAISILHSFSQVFACVSCFP